MNIYESTLRDCKIGIKTFQNINAASIGFSKMLDLAETIDPILMPSVFYWAVIRYAKPFLNSNYGKGKIVYPVKHLKNVQGFSLQMHEHLKIVRNTLVAHDDFTEMPSHILICGINYPAEDFLIPTSIIASNKCISFPQDINTVKKMQTHSQACCSGVHSKLIEDIEKLRELTLTEPKLAREGHKYQKDYGKTNIGVEKSIIQPPDFMNDEWLDVPVPDFSELHNGYRYEETKVNKDFHGPEKITTPNGSIISLTPNNETR
jgi:hypothetical protein